MNKLHIMLLCSAFSVTQVSWTAEEEGKELKSSEKQTIFLTWNIFKTTDSPHQLPSAQHLLSIFRSSAQEVELSFSDDQDLLDLINSRKNNEFMCEALTILCSTQNILEETRLHCLNTYYGIKDRLDKIKDYENDSLLMDIHTLLTKKLEQAKTKIDQN